MSTIDKKHINESIKNSLEIQKPLYIFREEISIPIGSGYYSINNSRAIAKIKKSDLSKLFFSKRKKKRFPISRSSSMIRFYNNNITVKLQKENKALSGAKFISKYLDFLNLDVEGIKYKETNESYLIEFFYHRDYFLIEFFHDDDIVLLIRNNENDNRKAWDFTTDQIINLLQVIKENTVMKNVQM